jgi:hypothetical protein
MKKNKLVLSSFELALTRKQLATVRKELGKFKSQLGKMALCFQPVEHRKVLKITLISSRLGNALEAVREIGEL